MNLPDTPETLIALHLLRQGLGTAYRDENVLWVHPNNDPSEPIGFGNEVASLWDVLRTIEGWKYPNVSVEVAPELLNIVTRGTGQAWKLYPDIYHTLTQTPPALDHPDVRLMTLDDVEMLEHAAPEVRPTAFGSPRNAVIHGYAACTVVGGEIVALAQTYARSQKYSDVGVSTLEPYRKRGYAASAASLVCQNIIADGQIPVWSCGGDNIASLKTAARLGFKKVSRRMYFIPTAPRPTDG